MEEEKRMIIWREDESEEGTTVLLASEQHGSVEKGAMMDRASINSGPET